MTCTESVVLLERQFAEGLSATDGASLRAHVAGCDRCRHTQTQLANVDEALSGQVLSLQRMEQLEAELFQAPALATPIRPRRRWVGPAAAFAAAAGLAVAVWFRAPLDDFQARGGPGAGVALKALCVGAPADAVAVAKPGETLACGPGQTVQLVYSAPERVRVTAKTAAGDDLLAAGLVLDAATEAAVPTSTPVGPWLSQPTELTVTFTAEATGVELSTLRLRLTPPAR